MYVRPARHRPQIAYFRVHSLAVASYRERSVLYTCAISGTSGSSGFGSVSMEQIDRRTVSTCFSEMYSTVKARSSAKSALSGIVPFEMVRAGLHWSLSMSKQILPLLLMFGW